MCVTIDRNKKIFYTDNNGTFSISDISKGPNIVNISSIRCLSKDIDVMIKADTITTILVKLYNYNDPSSALAPDSEKTAGKYGILKGKVVDKQTGEPLAFATIFVEGTQRGGQSKNQRNICNNENQSRYLHC